MPRAGAGCWGGVGRVAQGQAPTLSYQVQSILEQSTPWQERRAVSLPQGLLEGSWDAEAPAWVLLEECGLELQVDDPQVCWEPEARDHTCTLYACLALLLCLSEDPC